MTVTSAYVGTMARPVICVVGAGTAGLEGLLAAHAQFGSSADLRVIAPEREFRYRPISDASLFRPARERGAAITRLAAEIGATHIRDRVAAVSQTDRCIETRDGDLIGFDYLLIAPGGRQERSLQQGYVWERGCDPGFLDHVLGVVRHRSTPTRVAVIVPRGARWPVPAYELALVLAWASTGTAAKISLITSEPRLLGALGDAATEAITQELEAAGVEAITGVEVIDAPRDDATQRKLHGVERADVTLVGEGIVSDDDVLTGTPTAPTQMHQRVRQARTFEFLIALPTRVGPSLAGVATDATGFVEVDEGFRVRGSERLWAAGSCIAAALEHSALSALQADAAAAAIAHAAGVKAMDDADSIPDPPEVTGILLTGQRDRWLAENPSGTREPSTHCLWWPSGRAVGHLLARQIASWESAVQVFLPGHPDGVPIRVPVALGKDTTLPRTVGGLRDDDVRNARRRDLENRQLMAVERCEREAAEELRALSTGLDALAVHERQVVASLRQHGYLLSDRETSVPVLVASGRCS